MGNRRVIPENTKTGKTLSEILIPAGFSQSEKSIVPDATFTKNYDGVTLSVDALVEVDRTKANWAVDGDFWMSPKLSFYISFVQRSSLLVFSIKTHDHVSDEDLSHEIQLIIPKFVNLIEDFPILKFLEFLKKNPTRTCKDTGFSFFELDLSGNQ